MSGGGKAGWVLCVMAIAAAVIYAATAKESMPAEANLFDSATAAYQKGDFGEAAYQFRKIAEADAWSHGAQHNLGNVEWKVARPGYAVLAWERARALNPSDRNTQANLRFARWKAGLSAPEQRWYEQYSAWLPARLWMWCASIGLWGGISLLAFPRLLNVNRADWHQAVAAVLLAVFLLATPALVGLATRRQLGVVLGEEAKLILTPTDDGEPLADVSAGEMARVEAERGNYYYVRAENDRAGWIRGSEFARVWQ